ncbi:hypothetical protein [Acutalibacter muris]|uniref:hypothetical protein n=1 Tax=Acutalibacter muris TaxID=1796620 RepID=UPI0020CDA3A2|nr:hypothetical protein [Acutalibacter muris]
MALEFDPAVNRYQAVSNYTKAAETGKTAEASKTAESLKAGEAAAEEGKTQEKTDSVELSGDAKSVNKMSAEERAALVKSLKADQEYQMTRFINMMTQTFQKQGMTAKSANDDSFWRMFASGNLQVDQETKAAAQEAISENGYWGVKQTSERIFQMAQALAGDDPEKMKAMQAAVKKGYEAAGKAWGGDLPGIAGETISAVDKMFEDYFAGYGKTGDEE